MKKDQRISFIRMLCTAMVVSLHISQQYEKINHSFRYLTDWLNLGLVMFFCISAFLYSNRTITSVPKWYLHRYIEIVVPSIIVGVCTLFVFSFKGTITFDTTINTLVACMGLEVFAPDSWMFMQLWFLTYILFFYLILPFIQKINCKKCSETLFWSVFVIILLLAQLFSIIFERIIGINLLSTGMLLRIFLPYFLFRRHDINGTKIRPTIFVLTGLSSVLIVITCILRYSSTIVFPDSIIELLFIYTQSISGTVLFYWLYQALRKLQGMPLILKLSDKFSYEIYLTHCLFIGYSSSLIVAYHHKWLGVVLALAATIISSVALHYVSVPIKLLLNRQKHIQ